MAASTEHIVLLPVMAHGHLIPFLALARQIQRRTGFKVTVANTPLNIQYLRSTIDKDDCSSLPKSPINLAELPFCSSDYGLPPNSENTENLPLDLVAKLFASSVNLKAPFRRLLEDITEEEGRPPLCVISDVFFGWAREVAEGVGSVHVTFTTGGAYGTLAYVSIWLNLPHRRAESEEFSLPGFPERCKFHISQFHRFLRMADGSDSWSRFFQTQIPSSLQSFGWLCNTCEEIEPLALKWLRNYLKLPLWAIGPLLPPALQKSYKQRSGKEPGIPTEKCLEWLDLHEPGSVLYISFGSQNTINPSQMMELAIGLEGSQKPFIWVIRPPLGFDIRGEFRAEWLPEGFEERINKTKQGLLVRNWAPQLEILSHKSTGAFLSHCGWNSVVESLSRGVPLIGWSMAAEQAYNAKMLVEEIGVCVELTRGTQSAINGEQVKELVKMVMNEKGKGGEMKRKAEQIGKQIRAAIKEEGEEKGSSIEALDNFFDAIAAKRRELISGLDSNSSA